MKIHRLRFKVYFVVMCGLIFGYFNEFFTPGSSTEQYDLSSTAARPDITFESEPDQPFSVIKAPDVLEKLEEKGFSLASMLNSIDKESFSPEVLSTSNYDVYQSSPLFKSIVATVSQDLKEIIEDENKAERGSAGVGMGFSKRVFDERWFQAKHAQFELIGIINRTDRMSLDTETCGEIRFIYRLSYNAIKPQKMYSRMPMTLMLKFTQPQENNDYKSCRKFARLWVNPHQPMNGAQYVDWLISENAPLGQNHFKIKTFKTAEINMQAFRIPATIRRTMGGHASYLLRVFKKQDHSLVPDYLENTPDVARIKADPKLKSALLKFIKDTGVATGDDRNVQERTDQFHRLEFGIIVIPDEFLAKKAISYSPYGVSRYSNKLFNQIFTEADFADAKFYRHKYVKTPDAVLRRLNDLSCVGCHQGRAMAGFHFLGLDKATTHPMNSLNFEGSGHFQIELGRRAKFLDDVRNGGSFTTNPGRDFSIAPPKGGKAGYGHFCGLPNTKGFDHWQCEDGLTCQKSDEAQGEKILGKCLPEIKKSGDPCMYGAVTQTDRNRDEILLEPNKRCNEGRGAYTCSPVVGPLGTKLGGFPSGACAALTCKDLDPKSEVCGRIAAKGFSLCLGDSSKTFEQCLDSFSQDQGLGLCNKDRACRNDYVCVRVDKDHGACMPSYFVFQVRQDGHPVPQ